jgi:trehalose 6-phosphate synthase
MTVQSAPPSIGPMRPDRRAGDGTGPLMDETDQKRLIVVSNRVADLTSSAQTGGLAVGLGDAIGQKGGVWIGWDGKREGTTGGPVEISQNGPITTVGIPISPADFSDYYVEYANSVLWPLFHYRLDLVNITPTAFDGYMRVNESFARQLVPILRPDDVIWVHDYHLIPLATLLRRMGCRQRIGHFMHIPFPPPELLSATPHHRFLVEALLDYDLLGFQTHTDVGNLKSYLKTYLPYASVEHDVIDIGSRAVRVGRFPIGIDVDEFNALSRKIPDDGAVAGVHTPKRRRIIGVDRLDYSKGLTARFRAFGELLSQHPELAEEVEFMQIAPISRGELDAYADIRVELEQLAGSINGRFARLDWTPVQYISRPLPRDVLAPLMRQSDVGFVTPLRDGMNLVAKEFVAAQDPRDPGVLVLSQFAGAAEEMKEAIIVNPYDTENMAERLHRALTMPLPERRRRHATLLRHIKTHDAKAWSDAFVSALTRPR